MAKSLLNYEFAPQGSGDDEGYNDPIRTHFDVNIASSIAREAIQNIIDARDRDTGKPAKAEFKLVHFPPSAIPDNEKLVEILSACQKYYAASPVAKGFTENALKMLKGKSQLSVLKISDFNTVGLTGEDDDRESNYHNFMKAAGATNKVGDTGGSFGLGKGALFAASAFATIFVRSKFGKGKNVGHLFQGKCRFMSHKIGGTVYRAVGSYGLPNQKPLRDLAAIPPEFAREENGTDIYIIGLRNEDNWADDILKSVLHNFWRAIVKGDLEVEVDNALISKDNLHSMMLKHFDETSEGTDENPNPLPYYLAYTDPQKKVFENSFPTLGKVQCYLLPKEKFPNRVACFRKTGMLIQTKLFHSPLVRYAGVFLCENDKGNEVLKYLEPPSHDRWDKNSSNAKTPEGKPRRECSAADREFQAFVRECVRTLATTDDRKQMAVGGLEQYLNMPADEDELLENLGREGGIEVKPSAQESGMEGAFTDNQMPFVPPPRRLKVSKAEAAGKDVPEEAVIPAGGQNEGDGPPSPEPTPWAGPGPDERPGKAGDGEIKVQVISGATYRSFCSNDPEDGLVHIVIVRGARRSRCHIRVMAGTDNAYDAVPIARASSVETGDKLEVSGNFIKNVPLGGAGEGKVKIRFGGTEKYSLNVGVYEDS